MPTTIGILFNTNEAFSDLLSGIRPWVERFGGEQADHCATALAHILFGYICTLSKWCDR